MNIDNDSNGNPVYSDYRFEEFDRVNQSSGDRGSKPAIGGMEDNEYNGLFGVDQYVMQNDRSGDSVYTGGTQTEARFGDKGDAYIQNISMNMPGGFVVYDKMEVENSPSFTLESYDDPMMEMVSKDQDMNLDSPSKYSNQTNLRIGGAMDPRELDSDGRMRSLSISSHTPESLQVFHDDPMEQNNMTMQNNQRGPGVNSNVFGNESLQVNNANSNFYNELSPLTTTTSLTPSVGSVYSTQPSFFSAQQYITRNSLDQPPSQSIHRQSIDLFQNSRPSIDSQRSSQRHRGQPNGRYASFTNSITNYIPFMNGNQRSTENSPNSASISVSSPVYSNFVSPVQPQPRYNIRSIFKSSQGPNTEQNNNNNFNDNNDDINGVRGFNSTGIKIEEDVSASEFLLMSPTKEYGESDQGYGVSNNKKDKKPKRSLFTRFKTPVKTEHYDGNDPFKHEDSIKPNNDFSSFEHGNTSGQDSSLNQSLSSSIAPNSNWGLVDFGTQNNTLPNNETVNSNQQEPDYAALFEKVGKRKNIVNKKSKAKIKNDTPNTNSNNVESSVLSNNSLSNQDVNSTDCIKQENISSCSSNISSSNNPNQSDTKKSNFMMPNSSTTSTFANASKRILGSKLISKKKDEGQNYIIETDIQRDVDVEIDLKTLDLPSTTQIFPSNIVSSKTRIRGRKENKEADLVDSSKIYQCNYCSRRFKRQEHLKRHFRSLHTFEKPYECPICQKKFSRADNLGQHLKIHKQEDEMIENESNII